MASRTAFFATRFLTSIRTIGQFCPPTCPSHVRSITSYNGLLGASKIQPVEELMNPDEANTYVGVFGDAMEKWQQEAEQMRQIRLLPEDLELTSKIAEASREQLVNLLEEIETESLDIRQGWVMTANY